MKECYETLEKFFNVWNISASFKNDFSETIKLSLELTIDVEIINTEMKWNENREKTLLFEVMFYLSAIIRL